MPSGVHGDHVLLILAHHALHQAGRGCSLLVLLEVIEIVLQDVGEEHRSLFFGPLDARLLLGMQGTQLLGLAVEVAGVVGTGIALGHTLVLVVLQAGRGVHHLLLVDVVVGDADPRLGGE